MNRAALAARIRRWVARLAIVVAAGSVATLLVGAALSDRFHATQYIAWIPVWCTAGLTALSLALACLASPTARPRLRRAGYTASALLVVWVLAAEWRWYRALIPNSRSAQPVRILAWNPAWEKMSAFHERVLAAKPDVFLAANPNPNADWVKLREGFGAPTYTVRQGTLVVVSKHPIRRFAWTPLNIAPEPDRPSWWKVPKTSTQGGEALCVVLDVPGFDEGLVVWFLDLPSDAWIARHRMIAEASASIRAFRGPFLRRDDQGRDVPEDALRLGQLLPNGGFESQPEAAGVRGFPDPDLVVGDFNTPRASRSLSQLAPNLRDACTLAGVGPLGTFPRTFPFLHIDLALIGHRAQATRYDTWDMGVAWHMAQVVEIAPAK